MTTRHLRTLALVEAISWMVMLAAVVAKRLFGLDEAVTVMGPVHGVIFLVYAGAVLAMREQLGWDGRKTIVKFELLADLDTERAEAVVNFAGAEELGAVNLRGTGYATRGVVDGEERGRHADGRADRPGCV